MLLLLLLVGALTFSFLSFLRAKETLAVLFLQATHNFVGCLYREIHLQGLSQQQLLPQGALTVGEPLAEGGPSGSPPNGEGQETQEAAGSAKEQQQQLMLLQQQLRLLSSEREASASV